MTFLPETSFDSARRVFNRWRLKIINEERIQLGIFYIISHKNFHKHIHALMIGRNRHGKRLTECSTTRWENEWRREARIETVNEYEGICNYVALHFMGFKSDWYEYDFYGRNLLQQEMIQHTEGDYNVDLI